MYEQVVRKCEYGRYVISIRFIGRDVVKVNTIFIVAWAIVPGYLTCAYYGVCVINSADRRHIVFNQRQPAPAVINNDNAGDAPYLTRPDRTIGNVRRHDNTYALRSSRFLIMSVCARVQCWTRAYDRRRKKSIFFFFLFQGGKSRLKPRSATSYGNIVLCPIWT